jgi:hypothetical protein
MCKLGRVLSETRRFTEADDLLQRAYYGLRSSGRYPGQELECARNLGNSFLNQKRFSAAKHIMQRVVDHSLSEFGLEDRRTLSAPQNLSCVFRMIDMSEEA